MHTAVRGMHGNHANRRNILWYLSITTSIQDMHYAKQKRKVTQTICVTPCTKRTQMERRKNNMSKVDEIMMWYNGLTPEEQLEVESSVTETLAYVLDTIKE